MITAFVVVISGVVFLVGSLAGLSYWRKHKKDAYDGGGGLAIFVIGLLCTIGVIIIPIVAQQACTLSLPLQIAALERTIEQQTALISNEATLGQGLEGLEIKREIQITIRELNDKIAYAEYITVSPWWMFKPNMNR